MLEIQCTNSGFRVHVYSTFTGKGTMGHGTSNIDRLQRDFG